MKRGRGPRRDTPAAREFANRRGAALKRDQAKPLVRDPKRAPRRRRREPLPAPLAALKAELETAWMTFARAGVCAVCGRRCGVVRGHHVIEKQRLRQECRARGYDVERTLRVLWDRRNELRVGDPCHHDHHFSGRATVTRRVVDRHCPDLAAFLAELDAVPLLDRYYPPEEG